MFEIYKQKGNAKESTISAKKAQIQYLFDIAMDREDNCLLNGKPFEKSPRVFNRQIKSNYFQTIEIETNNESDYFKSGAIVNYASYDWICASSFVFHNLYCKGLFWRCNYKLKWLNNEKKIIEMPCLVQTSSQVLLGINDNKVFQVGTDELLVILPCNEETVALRRDKKFFIDKNKKNPTPYILTRIITIPYSDFENGCVGIVVKETQLNTETDSIEDWLCDYKQEDIKEIETNFEIKCSSATVRCGGSAKTFTAVTDSPVEWRLKLLDIQEQDIALTVLENNQCKIKCAYNTNLIGTSFKLVAKTETATQELLINVIGGV